MWPSRTILTSGRLLKRIWVYAIALRLGAQGLPDSSIGVGAFSKRFNSVPSGLTV
jgi:hypothetical protein